jgi:hypothetical protein
MGLSIRLFIADDYGLTPMSQARWQRFMSGAERLPRFANRELKQVEALVEVEGREVRRAIRILPYRVPVGADGQANRKSLAARAMMALDNLTNKRSVERAIRELEQDASYFWVVTAIHWEALSRHLKLPVSELKAALYRAPHSSE